MNKISDEKRLEIAQAYERGDSYSQIYERFAVHSKTVRRIAVEFGIPNRGQKKGVRIRQIGENQSVPAASFSLVYLERLKQRLAQAVSQRVKAERLFRDAKQNEERVRVELQKCASAMRQQLDALLSDVDIPDTTHHAVVQSTHRDILMAEAIEHQHRSEGQQARRQNERDEKRVLALPLK